MEQRVSKEDFLDHNSEHVAFKNKTVTAHNAKMLTSLTTEEVAIPAIKAKVKGHTYKIDPDTNNIDNTNFKNLLKIKIGARVCIIFNINTVDELVNGTSGTIMDIVKNRRGLVEAVIIKCDQLSSGKEQRKKHKHMLKPEKHENGIPILRHKLEYQATSRRGFQQTLRVSVTQFPLTLSWASTAHKMQVNLPFIFG